MTCGDIEMLATSLRGSIAAERINSRWDIDKFYQESTVSFLVKRIKKLTSDVHFSEQNFIIFHISIF